MTENTSEAFGMLIGCIEINGSTPEEARERVIDEGMPAVEVDKLLKEHWGYEP
jgi:hypothetical protein